MSDKDTAAALILAREWQQTIEALAADTAECIEFVKDIELNVETGHPFYWGKMALLKTLRPLADADVRRFDGPESRKLLDDMEKADLVLSVAGDLVTWYRFILRYVPEDEYDEALARLQAFTGVTGVK